MDDDLASPYDGLTFHPDGTISVDLDDGRRRLRRPKLGELRRLREARARTLEALLAVVEDFKKRAEEQFGEDGEVSTPEAKEADAKLTAEAIAEQENIVIGWLRLVFDGGEFPDGKRFDGLADRKLPDDDDDLPPWFANRQQVPSAQIIEHWLLTPPPRGAA